MGLVLLGSPSQGASDDDRPILYSYFTNLPGNYSTVWSVDPSTLQARQLVAGRSHVFSGEWSPDGTRFSYYAGYQRRLKVADADGTHRVRLTAKREGGLDGDARQADWSPNGKRLAYSYVEDTTPGSESALYKAFIATVRTDGTGRRQLTKARFDNMSPDWSPDGSKIAYVSNRDGNYEIFVMDRDGTNKVQLTHEQDAVESFYPRWSPDGTEIVFQRSPSPIEPAQIYVMEADGTNIRQLTSEAKTSTQPQWSPDGSKISFTSTREHSRYHVFVMDKDGSNVVRVTVFDGADHQDYAWSPSGEFIVYAMGASRETGLDLYKVEIDGLLTVRLTTQAGNESSPDW